MRLLATILATILLQGCASMSLQAKRVVEQSRQNRPPWVTTTPESWRIDMSTFDYVASKERIIDITLGLDQAYVSAIAEMRVKVRDFLVLYWSQEASFAAFSAEDRSLLDRQLLNTLDRRLDGAIVQDIYFEKLVNPTAEDSLRDTFTVYVQLRLESFELAQLFSEIQSTLASSSRPTWQKFAQLPQAFPVAALQSRHPISHAVDSVGDSNYAE